jgi:hypothetical protein
VGPLLFKDCVPGKDLGNFELEWFLTIHDNHLDDRDRIRDQNIDGADLIVVPMRIQLQAVLCL